MAKSVIELKSCPFCGKAAQLKHVTDSLRGDKYMIRCGDTACLGRSYRRFPTEKSAVKAWNRRANDESGVLTE